MWASHPHIHMHYILKLRRIYFDICTSQSEGLTYKEDFCRSEWVFVFDVPGCWKHFLNSNSIVAVLEWSEHDVMLSKLGQLATGMKMPGTVPAAGFAEMFPSEHLTDKRKTLRYLSEQQRHRGSHVRASR